MTMVLFQVIQVGHWWNIFSFTQIHDEVLKFEMLEGDDWDNRHTWIQFNIIQQKTRQNASPVEKLAFCGPHLQAQDSVAFAEPKAQGVENEVWRASRGGPDCGWVELVVGGVF